MLFGTEAHSFPLSLSSRILSCTTKTCTAVSVLEDSLTFPVFHLLSKISMFLGLWAEKTGLQRKKSKCYLSGRPGGLRYSERQHNLCCPCGMTGMFLSTRHVLCVAKCRLATYSFLFLQVKQVHWHQPILERKSGGNEGTKWADQRMNVSLW